MATATDVVKAQNDNIAAVDAQLKVTMGLQTGGADAKIAKAVSDLMDKKQAIRDEAVDNLLADPDFDAAVTALQTAARNMNTIAAKMKDATGVINNINTFLGYGTDAIKAIQSIKLPKP